MNRTIRLAALAALLVAAGGCSQKDPAQQAISAAEGALAAVYEDARKYVPERYAEVKLQLDAARTAFNEERYADAIAAVRDVPARAEELASAALAARQKLHEQLNADWTRLSGSLPKLVAGIEARLGELGSMRRLPAGMDKQLLDEANAAFDSVKNTWDEAGTSFAAGEIEVAVAKAGSAETMAQDLMARLGLQAG